MLNHTYSVPARLIGERVRVRLHHDRLEVYFAGQAGRAPAADPRPACGAHRLSSRDLVAGEEARRVRPLSLARGAVPDAWSFAAATMRCAVSMASAPTPSTCASSI